MVFLFICMFIDFICYIIIYGTLCIVYTFCDTLHTSQVSLYRLRLNYSIDNSHILFIEHKVLSRSKGFWLSYVCMTTIYAIWKKNFQLKHTKHCINRCFASECTVILLRYHYYYHFFCVWSLSIIFFSGSTFMGQFILQWSDFNLKQWN